MKLHLYGSHIGISFSEYFIEKCNFSIGFSIPLLNNLSNQLNDCHKEKFGYLAYSINIPGRQVLDIKKRADSSLESAQGRSGRLGEHARQTTDITI
jgi:hypothetical protein